jgi:hypothetical protein
MIGPDYRVAGAHSPEIERVLPHTSPGQADFAAPERHRECGDCVEFLVKPRTSGRKGFCALYMRRMQGRQGATLFNSQCARRQFEARS